MSGVIESRWTYAVTFLEMLCGDNSISTATGFFWRIDERYFLITNWHVLSGRNPETQQPQSSVGVLPDKVVFFAYRATSEPDDQGLVNLQWKNIIPAPLYRGDFESALWLEHPTFGRAVDIAALDITSSMGSLPNRHAFGANELESDADVQPCAGQDAFVLGYPLGLVTKDVLPIWKRASIATEPSRDPGGMPRVFVDTATRAGMSGSLVLARHWLTGPYRKLDGSLSNTIFAERDRILGVYSGRLGLDELQAQLGIVWKRRLVDEIVRGGRPGQIGIQ